MPLRTNFALLLRNLSWSDFIISIPFYVSFLFGLLRDRWKPFGIADRPYLLLSPIIISACCLFVGAFRDHFLCCIACHHQCQLNANWSGYVRHACSALQAIWPFSGRISVAAL